MNSIISWVGGKKALRELIYQRMPKEFGRYIEVFGGGGWVLFGRPVDTAMEVYNDFNYDLTNMFRCAKEQTLALIQELNFLPLNGRDEFGVLRRYLEKQEFTSEYLAKELVLAERSLSPLEYEDIRQILTEKAVMNDVKRAAAFYKLIRYSYGSEKMDWPEIENAQPNNVAYALYQIKEISFEDGSVWNNSEYSNWLETYKGKTVEVLVLESFYPSKYKIMQ